MARRKALVNVSGALQELAAGDLLVGGNEAAAIVATSGAIANTETVVASYSIAANELAAGTTFEVIAYAAQAGTNAATPIARVRIGPTTLIGNIAATVTGQVGTTAANIKIQALITIRSIGSGGSVLGAMSHEKSLQSPVITPTTATVAVNTTVTNLLELTFISGQAANSYTFYVASITKVSP